MTASGVALAVVIGVFLAMATPRSTTFSWQQGCEIAIGSRDRIHGGSATTAFAAGATASSLVAVVVIVVDVVVFATGMPVVPGGTATAGASCVDGGVAHTGGVTADATGAAGDGGVRLATTTMATAAIPHSTLDVCDTGALRLVLAVRSVLIYISFDHLIQCIGRFPAVSCWLVATKIKAMFGVSMRQLLCYRCYCCCCYYWWWVEVLDVTTRMSWLAAKAPPSKATVFPLVVLLFTWLLCLFPCWHA